MNKNVELSVIIPAYNESKNIKAGSLDSVYDYLKTQNFTYEIVVVDDGSSDNTASLVEDYIKGKDNIYLIKNEHGGKAITVMTGILKSSGKIAVFSDMDQSTPIKEIEKFFPLFEKGYDVVVGSRSGRKGAPLIRKIYALGFSVLRQILLGFSFDTQCGFKAFRREVVERVFPKLLDDWLKKKSSGAAVNAGFDVELLYIVKKNKFKVTDVVVDWHYVGSERVGVSAAVEALGDMLRIRLKDLKGKYA